LQAEIALTHTGKIQLVGHAMRAIQVA